MIFLFTAVSAIAPSLLIVWYFHRRDVFPEPGRVIWATFGLGVVIVFPVILVELVIAAVVNQVPGAVLRGALDAFGVAAFTEESFKLLVLLTYVWRHRAFDEPMDGIVYGVVASLGFATLENVLYVFQGGVGIAVMRALTSVPSHATEGAIMGYFIGRAKFAPSGRAALVAAGFGAAFLLHGLYDFPLLSLSAGTEIAKAAGTEAPNFLLALLPITFIALGASITGALGLTRRLRKEQLAGLNFFAPRAAAGPAAATAPTPARPVYPARSQPVSATAPRPDRTAALAALAGGFVLGSGGGMIVLAMIIAFAIGSVKASDTAAALLGAFFIGGLPMAAGAVLFTVGIAKLNKA
jgi:RsiW-degrading membrane proteinase PrsW (M82 family)